MIKLEKHEVVGWEHAIRGMRNPMNSWDKSEGNYRVKLCAKCDDCETAKDETWEDCLDCEVQKLVACRCIYRVYIFHGRPARDRKDG